MNVKNYGTVKARHGHGTELLKLIFVQICKDIVGEVPCPFRSFLKSYEIHSDIVSILKVINASLRKLWSMWLIKQEKQMFAHAR